ncbi:MAG: hypothetical protein GTN73_06335 [Candidatus Aminicenantes bacterium]|nr:hypothetical protein [Candidatus Aminicenantes bacterium]
MIIDVEKLPKEGQKISKDFEFLSAALVEESAVLLKPVHAELTVKKVGEEILIKGKIVTSLSLICSRCLVPFKSSFDSRLDLVYLPEELDVMQDQLESDDINKLFYYNGKIDIEEVILEQLNLVFPAKPLCSDDCQGICPVCGKVIRESKCVCVTKDSDPRLKKLKIFIKNKN